MQPLPVASISSLAVSIVDLRSPQGKCLTRCDCPQGAILENVPATIVAPVPGPPDFNGASAVIARLPNIGFAPSMLTEKGFEVWLTWMREERGAGAGGVWGWGVGGGVLTEGGS
jgi:hypothetical protein